MMFWLLYLLTGAVVGVLAGLLGIGGGVIIVPLLTFTFVAQQFPEVYILHLALGTSLATIIFTSISSFRAHHARGAVNWAAVKALAPGILIGTFLGTWVAAQLTSRFLSVFFVCFLYYVALQLLLNIRPSSTRTLPGATGMFGVGGVIGGVSSLVGIGGGSLTVPFLNWCNQSIHTAVGTSAAVGLPIAVAGTLGYLLNGLAVADLPAGSVGFIYLPALFGVAVVSYLTAPFGVRLAHRLPVARLKKIFAVFLMLMGTRMLISFF
ncbi:MAG: sulfite exporter TauE/SafE family protein [Pelovirga sp.]